MLDIVIVCPTFNKAVPTGLKTEQIKLASLSGLILSLSCPACQKVHQWQHYQAWVAESGYPAGVAISRAGIA